jgi:hypothetical protein
MSQNETTDSGGRPEVSEFRNGNLSKLAELARQGYEQKRTKDCLDLTRAMLLINPDHTDAQWMRSSIRSDMHQDLEIARKFMRQTNYKENPEMQSQPVQTAVRTSVRSDSATEVPKPLLWAGTGSLLTASANSRRGLETRWVVGAGVLIVFGAMFAGLPKFNTKSNPLEASPPPLSAPGKPNAPQKPKEIVRANAVQPESLSPAATQPAQVASARSSTAARASAPSPGAGLPDRHVIANATGTLAINSYTSVDIYKGEKYLGSVPISLKLPAGEQTLEYRHDSLRRTVTHVINSNETTRAIINFDVTVQINSRPWAEVFIEGPEKKVLGQTPLSNVGVPIGSVLIFENPQFQSKKYRVTENETRIQILFP